MSDNELGTFLRARREAVTPAEVGLPSGPRRRTPGLRRAELATLAGISVEYLTRLEQGRDRNPSPQVLGVLSDALHLPVRERILLRRLAKESGGGAVFCAQTAAEPTRTVRPSVRAMLDRLEPTPAVLLNWTGDILEYTDGYQRLAGPLGVLDGSRPNMLRYIFTDERARAAFTDWGRAADEQVAHLRNETSLQEPHVAAIADELTVTAGACFADRISAVPTMPRRTGTELVTHPEAGALRLTYETLALPDDGHRMVVHLPADEATAAALDRLNGRKPGALRAVSG